MIVRPTQPAAACAERLLRAAHDEAAERLLRAAAHHLEQAARLEQEPAQPTHQEAPIDGR